MSLGVRARVSCFIVGYKAHLGEPEITCKGFYSKCIIFRDMGSIRCIAV